MRSIDLRSVTAFLLFLLSLVLLSFQDDQREFGYFISLYGLSFIGYIILLRQKKISSRVFLLLAISGHLIFLFSTPALSEDFYRFLWDGELINSGINPYDFTPDELMKTSQFSGDPYFTELYSGISDLSKENYTCYPVLNQIYFAVATFFTDSVLINLIILRLLLFLTYILCYIYLLKLLQFLHINERRIWVMFLNPLWIIETMGNLHFEGVMVTFMIIGCFFLLKQKLIKGATLITAAIQIKIVPLLILPFFFRYLGFLKAVMVYSLVLVLVLVSSLLLLNQYNVLNFADSLFLYFRLFEFNSFFFHYSMEYSHWHHGRWLNETLSFNLSNITVLFIGILSLFGDINDGRILLKRFVLGFTVYLMLSTTVHPWYIIPLLAYGLFTEFGYPVLWTFLIPLSYSGYVQEMKDLEIYRLLVGIEYISVLALLIFEIIRNRPILPRFLKEENNDHLWSSLSGTGSCP